MDEADEEPQTLFAKRPEGPAESGSGRQAWKRNGEIMNPEKRSTHRNCVEFGLCRTFGAHFSFVSYPCLTAEPIIFRAFGARPSKS